MAQLSFNDGWDEGGDFQRWIIEDSWEGTIYLEARLVDIWMGIFGTNKILEDREGHYYWWLILLAPERGGALQRIVTFLDWDSMAAELGREELRGQNALLKASRSH
jgi:hypothetical protein